MTEMTPAEAVFFAAAALPPAERPAYLARVCAGRDDLRQMVERMLAAQRDVGDFLEPSPATLAGLPAFDATATFGSRSVDATADRPGRDEVAGAVIAGKYTLVEAIGEGGMGSVWRAKQSEPVKRFVAVKLIKSGMDSKLVLARFEGERQALAMMDHPNIAKVLDGGLHEHRPYFVMELVKGVPITHYCDARKLTTTERLELFVPVCQAIQHAHQKGIIHRDIKPSNVLIALYDDKPVVKVIDFGVAKATSGALTEHTIDTGFGGVVGTPQYMSPEQATFNNIDIDTRSDVYALGVLLYELLTGSTPFSSAELKKKGLLEILRVVREEEPPRPSTKLSTADALPSLSANRGTEPKKLTGLLRNELDWIVMKALEKDRTRRYETANGFAADVNRYLAGEAVLAHPPSRSYRLKKFVRRNKGQVIAASLVLLALLAGMAGTTWGLFAARRAQERESQRADGEQKAKDDAVASQLRAEKAYARTADVLDTMVSDVTGYSLATQKAITAEQKKFLTEVLTYYQEFAGEKTDDAKMRQRAAHAANRVGMIELRLARKEESARAFRKGRDGYATLAAEFPAVPEYRHALARSQNNLGNLLQELGKKAEADEQHRQSLAIQEKLAAEFPAVPEYRNELANGHNSLAALLAGLGKRPEAEEQYRKALAIQEKLATDFPAVAEYRAYFAMSQDNLGILLAELGKPAEAEEQHRKALAIQQKLAADFPTMPEHRADMATSHKNLGNVLSGLGKQAEAEDEYRKSLAIRDKLVTEFPAVPDYRDELAQSLNGLGLLLTDLEKPGEAAEQHRKALAIRVKLAAEFPAVPDYRQMLARSHNNLGNLLRVLGKEAEADEQHRKALAVWEKLVAEFPDVPAYRVELGGSYCNFGNLLRDGGKVSGSLEWFAKAISTLAPIYEREPRDVTVRQFLRNSHAGRAIAHDRLEQYTKAIPNWDKAIEYSPEAEKPRWRAARASALFNAGQVAEAVPEIAELTKSPNWNAGQWYDFACVYAIASGKIADKKNEYAKRAVELLQRAVQAGYKDAAHIKKDTDLDPLRERKDFKTLIAELEKKNLPKEKP